VGVAAPPAALATAAHPDHELLVLIARFDALEREVVGMISGHETIEAEAAADDAAKPLRAEQEDLVTRICAMPTHKMDGLRARAASLTLWDYPMRKRVAEPDDPAGYANDRMMATMLRVILAGQGGAA
jgi:hypothetical protein